MQYFQFFIILILFQSCFSKRNEEKVPKINTIKLITSNLIDAQKIQLFHSAKNNSAYFYFGPFAEKIYEYNLNTFKCSDSFAISSKVGMIEDFQVINDSFIFQLYNESDFAIQPKNDSSKCKVLYSPKSDGGNYITFGSKYKNGKLYARFPPNCQLGTQAGWSHHFSNSLINVFSLNGDSILRIDSFGIYPDEYRTGLLVSLFHHFETSFENTIFVSHDLSDFVEVYNLLTKEMNTFKMSSNYFKEILYTPVGKVGDTYYEDNIINNNCFLEFIYNPYRKEFYRYFIHKSKTNEKEDLASILIKKIDSEQITEIVIEREKYTRACQIFPTLNGFALLKNLKTKKTNKQPLIIDEFNLD